MSSATPNERPETPNDKSSDGSHIAELGTLVPAVVPAATWTKIDLVVVPIIAAMYFLASLVILYFALLV